jgi:hypothetical protein
VGSRADTGVVLWPQRLCVRYERRADIHEAFLVLCCPLICLSYLTARCTVGDP